MQLLAGERLHSATDLVGHLECEALTALDLQALSDEGLASQRELLDESMELYSRKGDEHEKRHLQALRDRGLVVIDIGEAGDDLGARVAATVQAMKSGAAVIYQAALRDGSWMGYADFLMRVEGGPSLLGNWHYEVSDTKLARRAKAKALLQLATYSDMVAKVQERVPESMHVVLGDGREQAFRVADFSHYAAAARSRYLKTVEGLYSGVARAAYPVPRDHCNLCRWNSHCEAQRLSDDHLCQVAGIRLQQIEKLERGGVATLASLAALPAEHRVPRMRDETLAKLRRQAVLQHGAKVTGERSFELLPIEPGTQRGFLRLPAVDHGDMYFDMEGDPLEVDGLEYLFGVWFREESAWRFLPFWGHDRADERTAFEGFMDFVVSRRNAHPGAHVYHYANYEAAALKRLASMHATREAELDVLLRERVLVDLFRVVREAIRVSEESYSIKAIERFYRPPRDGGVQDAGTSIVAYERWRDIRDDAILEEIAAYNRDDVQSTQQLHDWLLRLRPTGLAWRPPKQAEAEGGKVTSEKTRAIEAELESFRQRLVVPLPADRGVWTAHDEQRELVWQLLDFHRREAKPDSWSIYARQDFDDEELLEDAECLAGLVLDPTRPPERVARSTVCTYLVPEQESKVKAGDSYLICATREYAGEITSWDEAAGRVSIKRSNASGTLPERMSIGPKWPINTDVLAGALLRYAKGVIDGGGAYAAVDGLLLRDPPRVDGRTSGQPVVDPAADVLAECLQAVRSLANSCLYVQGPPGAGKTHTGAHIIAALLRDGKRVGVMSNSHKAIHNLMARALIEATRHGVVVDVVKKSSGDKPESEFHCSGARVQNIERNEAAWAAEALLYGGTAWFFAHEAGDRRLDYLFIDEAGQVSLANAVAAGISARNIVLLGDQMQLGQPIKGMHPGHSGDSTLDYLLDGRATIPPERGIFLPTSWRMHPDVCRFISEAIYEGRLNPEPGNVRRTLVLDATADPSLRPSGVVHAAIDHSGCSQRSLEEAALASDLYASLLKQQYTDKHGIVHGMTPENILVIAPYNLQVRALQKALPEGAQVGTVDKFQGQEAEAVIVSMTTSSEADLPRDIAFLYSRNRLNVAISRAKCLAVVIANPRLMAVRCSTPDQMELVNTLCWAAELA